MQRVIYSLFTALLLLVLSGCGNLSPRQDQDINNQNGKIGQIENLANSLKAELGTMKSQNDIQNSQLEKIQQGLVNLQSNYENSGVQIFSGPGGLVVAVVAILVFGFLTLFYRNSAKMQEKAANIMAERIVQQRNPDLEEAVLQAAMYTDVEEKVLDLIKRHRRSLL